MKVLAKRFVVEIEAGDKLIGKTIVIRDSLTGHAYVLDQYPKSNWLIGKSGWIVTKKGGDFIGKFRTEKSALEHLKKLRRVML